MEDQPTSPTQGRPGQGHPAQDRLLARLNSSDRMLVGVLVGHEPFRLPKLLGYALIWAAFILASLDASRADHRRDNTVPLLSTSG